MPKNATKCPNCGQITDGEDCDWCKFPIRPLRVKHNQRNLNIGEQGRADQQNGIVVIEKAANDLEEARKALETEIAGWEKFRQEQEIRKAAEVADNKRVINAEEAFKAEEIRIVTDAEETFEAVTTDESIFAEDEKAGRVEEAEVVDEVLEAEETRIVAEVKESATAEFDEKLKELEAKREAIKKAQLETEQIKNPVDTSRAAYSETRDVSPIVAEYMRPRMYRKIVEPLLSLPITSNQYKTFKKCLERIESINRELSKNKIGTEEAIKKLREMTPNLLNE